MQLTVTKNELSRVIELLKGSVEPSRQVPIQECVAVDVTADALTLRATNTFREAEAIAVADVTEEGQACLSSAVLSEIVRRMPDNGTLEIKTDGSVLALVSGRSRYRIPFFPMEDFPESLVIDAGTNMVVSAANLVTLFKAGYATTRQDSRLFTGGVYLHTRDGFLACVATDGSRLGLRTSDHDAGDDFPPLVIPLDGAKEMARLLSDVDGDVRLLVSSSAIELHQPQFRFTSKLLDTSFPDYNRVIPAINGASVMIGCEELLAATERASGVLSVSNAVTDARSARVETTGNALILSAGPKAAPVVHEEIEAECTKPLSFGVQLSFLSDVLNQWPKNARIAIQCGGAGEAVLFTSENDPSQRHVVMPCRA